MNQVPIQVILIVVLAEAVLSAIGVSALCLSMFFKTYIDPVVLQAITVTTATLVGNLVGLLTNVRQPSPGASTTTTTTIIPPPPNGVPVPPPPPIPVPPVNPPPKP